MIKKEVRKEILNNRKLMSPESVRDKSRVIVDKIMASEEYLGARSMMIYIDFRNEVETGRLISHALSLGKRVFIPITDVDSKKLTPSGLADYPGDLEPGAWGILEPKKSCVRPVDPEELDVVIVPGVAYDQSGNRLGYGAGFYDRFLPRTRPETIFISPAFELQIVDDALPAWYDVPVHIIVTEDRVIKAANKRV